MRSPRPSTGGSQPQRGEIYLLRLDPTEGSEQAGTRPAVVVSRTSFSRASAVVVVCPFTDAARVPHRYPCDVEVRAPEGGLKKDSVVLTGQVRAVAKHRLLKRLGELSPETLRQVEQALKTTLDLP